MDVKLVSESVMSPSRRPGSCLLSGLGDCLLSREGLGLVTFVIMQGMETRVLGLPG